MDGGRVARSRRHLERAGVAGRRRRPRRRVDHGRRCRPPARYMKLSPPLFAGSNAIVEPRSTKERELVAVPIFVADDMVETAARVLLGGITVDDGPTEEQLAVLDAVVSHLWERPDLDVAALEPLDAE